MKSVEPVNDTHLRAVGTVDAGVVAEVGPDGNVTFADGSPPLRWFVAADDRWHDPAVDAAVRQSRVDGAPVFETRLRIPGGDIVQRVWAVVGRDTGREIDRSLRTRVVCDFENDSRLPVAIALTRRGLAVSRPLAARGGSGEWPAPGLDLPEPPVVIPIGHQSRVRVVITPGFSAAVDGTAVVEALPDDIVEPEAVVRGWTQLTERASHLSLDDVLDTRPISERVTGERAAIALEPPPNMFAGGDALVAAHWLLDVREATRLKVESYESSEIATAAEVLLRGGRAVERGLFAASVRAAAELLAPDERAMRDLSRAVTGSRRAALYEFLGNDRLVVSGSLARGAFTTALEESLVMPTGDDTITFLPDGCPAERLGTNFEVSGVGIGRGRTVSFAVRWHGGNAAILWEVTGTTKVDMRCGADLSWTSSSMAGEGLWRIEDFRPKVSTDLSFS